MSRNRSKPASNPSNPASSQLNPAVWQLKFQESQKELATQKETNQELTALLAIASAEAEEHKTRKQTLEQEIRSSADAIRAAHIEEGQRQAEQLKEKARSEAGRIVTDAEAEVARVREALTGREAALRVAEMKAREEAKAEQSRLLRETEGECERMLAAARADAERQLADHLAELATNEQNLQQRERSVRRRETEAETLSEDLGFERQQLDLKKTQLEMRWAQCSPDRIVILDEELATDRRLTAYYHAKVEALQKENEHLHAVAETGDGTTLESLQRELQAVTEHFRSLRTVHLQCPAAEDVAWLKEQAAEADRLREEVHSLRCRLMEAEARAGRNELHTLELQQARAQKEALVILNRELRDEIARNAKMLEGRQGQRFKKLMELDTKETSASTDPPGDHVKVNDLRELAEHIRQYAAVKEQLFYDETTIRAFLAGMATSRLAILQGLSGTGKTSLPRIVAEAIGARCPRIAVQSNWRDRHELLGYNNDFTGVFSETEFTEAVYEARLQHEKNRIWFIVLDEMNLARIEYYFADFLSALEEPDSQKRLVRLLHFDPAAQGESAPRYLEQGALRIPANIWFVGTANQDQSTHEITDKVYDRGQVIDFAERFQPFEVPSALLPTRVSAAGMQKQFAKAQSTLELQLNSTDRAFVGQIDRLLYTELGVTFGHRIDKQMDSFVPVFMAAGGKKSEAVDYLLSRKVLRKIEGYYESNLRSTLVQLQEILSHPPSGYAKMSYCLSLLEKKLKMLSGGSS